MHWPVIIATSVNTARIDLDNNKSLMMRMRKYKNLFSMVYHISLNTRPGVYFFQDIGGLSVKTRLAYKRRQRIFPFHRYVAMLLFFCSVLHYLFSCIFIFSVYANPLLGSHDILKFEGLGARYVNYYYGPPRIFRYNYSRFVKLSVIRGHHDQQGYAFLHGN